MDAWLPAAPYYICSLSMLFAAAVYLVAIRRRLRAPYYAFKVGTAATWAVAFLLIGVTVGPNHPLRAEAATLIRSLFLAGGALQLLWMAFFARSMIGIKRAR